MKLRQHLHSLRRFLVPALLFLLSSALTYPLWRNINLSCRADWDYFFALYEVPMRSLFAYGQFPLWNPYMCGGYPLIGNPQAGYLSPLFLFTALFGTVAGLKVAVLCHTFIGLWGTWLLAGELRIATPARLLPALIFVLSSAWALRIAEGHLVWLPASLFPLLFLCLLRGLQNTRWIAPGAACQAAMIYEGGVYVTGFMALFLASYTLVCSAERRSIRPIAIFTGMNILTLLLAAPRLLPAVEFLRGNPRQTTAGSSIPWDEFLAAFLERITSVDGSWTEYGAYVGLVVSVLYLVALIMVRGHLALKVASLIMLLVALGDASNILPWRYIHTLPVYSSFRLTSRAFIVCVFSISLLTGLYLNRLCQQGTRWGRLFVLLCTLFVGADLFAVSTTILGKTYIALDHYSFIMKFNRSKEEPPPVSLRDFTKISRTGMHLANLANLANLETNPPFQQISIPQLHRFYHGGWSDQFLPVTRNQGVVDAYEPIPVTSSAMALDDPRYRGEFHLQHVGSVQLLSWSPNRMVYRVSLPRPDRLVINQNHWPGWQSSVGSVQSYQGLLSIALPPGTFDVSVRFLPRSFLFGCLVCTVAMPLILLIWARSWAPVRGIFHRPARAVRTAGGSHHE